MQTVTEGLHGNFQTSQHGTQSLCGLGRYICSPFIFSFHSLAFVLSMTLNCGWEDLSSKIPSSSRAGGNGGGSFARETTFLNSRLGCILSA